MIWDITSINYQGVIGKFRFGRGAVPRRLR